LLAQAVILKLSVGVKGAWACNEVTRNIKIAVCSQYGSTKTVNARCSPIVVGADGNVRYNVTSCASNPALAVSVVGGKAFVASSAYPASTMVSLNEECNDPAIAGIDFFSED
jgi:hypothetical protein